MISKDPAKTGAKPNGRTQTKRRTRRRRESPVFAQFKRAMASPNFGWGVTISVLFIVLVGSVASWTREQPLVAVGRVMDRTQLSRLDFQLPDLQRTEDLRLEARNNSPRFYLSSSDATLAEIEQELTKLPQTLAGVETLDELSDDLRTKFALTDRSLSPFSLFSIS